MGGDTASIPSASGAHPQWRRLRMGAIIVVVIATMTAVAILWRHLAEGDEASVLADEVPSWVVGYVAGPGRTELTLVVEACEEWNLDETWTGAQNADHVELWVGWWSMSLPPCDAPELRAFEFGLLEPLGDREVFLLGGGEVPRLEGELPQGDN